MQVHWKYNTERWESGEGWREISDIYMGAVNLTTAQPLSLRGIEVRGNISRLLYTLTLSLGTRESKLQIGFIFDNALSKRKS